MSLPTRQLPKYTYEKREYKRPISAESVRAAIAESHGSLWERVTRDVEKGVRVIFISGRTIIAILILILIFLGVRYLLNKVSNSGDTLVTPTPVVEW